jgi:hypothetical protein
MMTNVTVDSDAAYKTAAADADAWLKKNPDKPLSMTLQNNARFQLPYWYMMWGTTKLGYAVVVNGTNGSVIHAK